MEGANMAGDWILFLSGVLVGLTLAILALACTATLARADARAEDTGEI